MLPNTIMHIYKDFLRSKPAEPAKIEFLRTFERYNINHINKVRYLKPQAAFNLLKVLGTKYPEYRELANEVLQASVEEIR